MAEYFQPKRHPSTDFNNGEMLGERELSDPNMINNIVESVLYAQDNGGGSGGGASLSNSYGDSTEIGYTQQAVNGVAQSKNYYNLGVFDTFVENADGTVSITRKTGYINFNDYLTGWGYQTNLNRWVYTGINILPPDGTQTLSTNKKEYSIGMTTTFLFINTTNNSLSELREFLRGCVGQYRVASDYWYEENAIKHQPIDTFYQEGIEWLKSEYAKSINLFDYSDRWRNVTLNAQTGEATANADYFSTPFIDAKPNTLYSFAGFDNNYVMFYAADKSYLGYTNDGKSVVTPNNCAYIRMDSHNSVGDNCIISEGRAALTLGYHSYLGDIVHKKDIEDLQNNIPTPSTDKAIYRHYISMRDNSSNIYFMLGIDLPFNYSLISYNEVLTILKALTDNYSDRVIPYVYYNSNNIVINIWNCSSTQILCKRSIDGKTYQSYDSLTFISDKVYTYSV